MNLEDSGHVAFECSSCERPYCQFCVGGLFGCSVCYSFEGATTSQCPGKRMDFKTIDQVYAGEVDFRDGQWVRAHSRYAPGWFQSDEGKQAMDLYLAGRHK